MKKIVIISSLALLSACSKDEINLKSETLDFTNKAPNLKVLFLPNSSDILAMKPFYTTKPLMDGAYTYEGTVDSLHSNGFDSQCNTYQLELTESDNTIQLGKQGTMNYHLKVEIIQWDDSTGASLRVLKNNTPIDRNLPRTQFPSYYNPYSYAKIPTDYGKFSHPVNNPTLSTDYFENVGNKPIISIKGNSSKQGIRKDLILKITVFDQFNASQSFLLKQHFKRN